MDRLFIYLLVSLLLTNIAWAHQSETKSQSQITQQATRIDTNESEKYNSLARGALAKQGVTVKLLFTHRSQVEHPRCTRTGEYNNSLFHNQQIKSLYKPLTPQHRRHLPIGHEGSADL